MQPPVSQAPSTGDLSKVGKPELVEALEPFGDLVPYADPSWYQTVSSPLASYHHHDLTD